MSGRDTAPVVRRAAAGAHVARDLVRVAVGSRAQVRPRAQLVMAPAGPGSEGDALLIRGVAQLVGDHCRSGAVSDAQEWPVPPPDRLVPAFVRLLRRSGTREDRSTLRWLRWVARRRWDGFWFVGADVLDGAYGMAHLPYLDLVDFGVSVGGRGGVCGFSFSEQPAAAAVERLQAMHPQTRFVARGSASAERFRLVVGRDCGVGPDLSWAWLLAEQAEAAPVDRARLRPTIGLNLSRQVGRRVGRDALVDAFVALAQRYRDRGFELRFLAHDRRPPDPDQVLLEAVARRLGIDPRRDLAAAGPNLRVAIRECTAVVSCRMHLAISAVSLGVPVVALDYADKLADLAQNPRLTGLLRVVDPTAGDVEQAIAGPLDELLEVGPARPEELARLHDAQRLALEHLRATLAGSAR